VKEPGIARLVTTADAARLGGYAERFVRLEVDAEWLNELAALAQARHGTLRTLAQRALRFYVSDFDANAITRMYRMLLLPRGAWQRLLGSAVSGHLLDVGAGAGDVTLELAQCFDAVTVSEISRGMQRRLRKLGFQCLPHDLSEVAPDAAGYDAVALLNVLDRCASPRKLLRNSLRALRPGGHLIVALALPYRPFYFDGSSTPDPLERLDLELGAVTWEDGARRLVERELLPLGLELVRLARAPYLSAGDSARALYEHDDVIGLLQKPSESAEALARRAPGD
jgi:SAM-dependent methyltransferase